MKTREIPATCSHVGCERAAVQATLAPFRALVSRCDKHVGKAISVNLNNVVDHVKAMTHDRPTGGYKKK